MKVDLRLCKVTVAKDNEPSWLSQLTPSPVLSPSHKDKDYLSIHGTTAIMSKPFRSLQVEAIQINLLHPLTHISKLQELLSGSSRSVPANLAS